MDLLGPPVVRYPYANARPLEYYYVLEREPMASFAARRPPPPSWNARRAADPYLDPGDGERPPFVRRVDSVFDDYVGPAVTSFGVLCLFLRHKMRVDVTVDRAVRLLNGPGGCSAAVDAGGSCSTVVHPSGRVYQSGVDVELQAFDWRHAKIGQRGITFATRGSPVVFLVDEGGVKTSVDKYHMLARDLPVDVFYERSRLGGGAVDACLEQLRKTRHRYDAAAKEHCWTGMNGVRVSQADDGDVTASRDQGRRVLKSSFVRGNVSVKTPLVYACASAPPEAHVFVRRGERRIHCSERDFVVRNGPRSAGLDECGKLKIF